VLGAIPLLRAAGHTVHAVTLTGVGERAHLLSADIRLRTHFQDAPDAAPRHAPGPARRPVA